jgi:perosamine synthetase
MVEQRRMIPVAEPMLGEHELEYVTDAVKSGWVSSIGHYVTEFERGIAAACTADEGVATCNGTAALHLALAVMGVGPGDEVIVPTLTFIATANAVRYLGATPVFVDSDPTHWCMDPVAVERWITPRTKAIVPVHIYGHPADMDAIIALAHRHGIAVVEDAAEALGASYRGRSVGALGDVGVLSFYGNKLITTGEGGMLVTNSKRIAERARMLRDHAMDPDRRYWHDEIGFNFRITNIQAAMGVAQLERLPWLLARKREIAARYKAGFAGIPNVCIQGEASWAGSSCWMSTIEVLGDEFLSHDGSTIGNARDRLADALRARGVDTRPVFIPLHMLPPYRKASVFRHAQGIARRGLSLPSAASLTDADQDYVIECVRDLASSNTASEPLRKAA